MAVEKINIRFDEDELTLGDLEDFEDATGQALFDAIKPVVVRDDEGNVVTDERGRPEKAVKISAKAMKALVWIVLRAERPGFTLDDARAIKVTALEMVDNSESEGNGEGQTGDDAESV